VREALDGHPVSSDAPDNRADLRGARERFERAFIQQALAEHDSIQATAEALGIDRSHLWKKMKQYGLQAEPGRSSRS
jgi:DNA-binding NtrC family response regulator